MLRPHPQPIPLPFHIEPHNNNGRFYEDDEGRFFPRYSLLLPTLTNECPVLAPLPFSFSRL